MCALEILLKDDSKIFEIRGELDNNDMNDIESLNVLFNDSDIKKAVDEKVAVKGLMKDYCVHCYATGKNIEFRAWSFVQAIARGIAECGGSCQVSKGKCS